MEDVTPPKLPITDNNTPVIDPAVAVETPTTETAMVPEMAPVTDIPATEAPAAPVENNGIVTPAPAVPESTVEQQPEHVETAAPIAADAKKKSAMPLIMLIVVLVVLGLAAAAYFAFYKEDAKIETPASQSTTTTTTKQDTTTDPDTVSESIDSSLNSIDDTKDYDTSNLSDTTLGL